MDLSGIGLDPFVRDPDAAFGYGRRICMRIPTHLLIKFDSRVLR